MEGTRLSILGWRWVVMLTAVLACAEVAVAKMSPDDTGRVFREANTAFDEANKSRGEAADELYEKAILGYRRLAEEGGIRNAKLYTNLGNTYLMMGDIGRAVLWYKRAGRLEPGNTEVARNLAYARSKRIDKVEPPAEKRVLQTLFFWHYDLSSHSRFVAASVSVGILLLLFARAVWAGRRAYLTAGATIAAIVFVAAAGSLVVEELSARTEGLIVTAEVVARQGDGTNYPEAFKEPLHAGTEFVMVEKRTGWVKIELADSSEGWVPVATVELF